MRLLRRAPAALTLAAMIFAPHVASACTACMGDPNSNIAKGANAAIFLMLGILAGMFALFGAFAFTLYRRSKAPTPPHAELDEFYPKRTGGSVA